MARHIRNEGTSNRQIEASDTTLTTGSRRTWHWNRDNGMALVADVLWKACVFAPEEQHISVLKFKFA
jgi:hypothetical protein